MVFSGLQVSEANLPDFLEGYLKKVPEHYVDTFGGTKKLVEKTKEATNPKWFAVNSHKNTSLTEIKGLFAYCKDSTGKKLTELLHVSMLPVLDMEKTASAILDHIWKRVDSEEIRIKLYHKMINGKLQCNETLGKLFKTQLSFKQLQVVNEPNSVRYLTLSLSRPKNLPVPEEQKRGQTGFLFKVGHFVALGKEQDKEPIPAQKKQLFWGQGNLVSILSNLTTRREVVSRPVLHKLIDLSQNIKGLIPNTVLYKAHELEKAHSLLESQKIQLPPEICGSFTAEPFCSVFSMTGNWTCYNTGQSKISGKNYPYVRVKQKDMIWFDDKAKGTLIFVPCEEYQMSMFFYKSGTNLDK